MTDAEGWKLEGDSLPLIRLAAAYDSIPFFPSRSTTYSSDPCTQRGKVLLLLDGPHFTVMESSFCDDLPNEKVLIVSSGLQFNVAAHLLKRYVSRLTLKSGNPGFVDPDTWTRYAAPADD